MSRFLWFTVYNFHGSTMTIKGSLQVSIAIVQAFQFRRKVSQKWVEI